MFNLSIPLPSDIMLFMLAARKAPHQQFLNMYLSCEDALKRGDSSLQMRSNLDKWQTTLT